VIHEGERGRSGKGEDHASSIRFSGERRPGEFYKRSTALGASLLSREMGHREELQLASTGESKKTGGRFRVRQACDQGR